MSDALQKRLFVLLLIFIFGMLLVLNLLTPLHVDDYYHMYRYAAGERITSLSILLDSAISHYFTMNGRIVTDVLFCQGVFMLGQRVFQFLNSLVYAAFILGLYLLLRGKKRHDWVLLGAIHAAVFLFAPVFGITVLWVSGASNYLWGTTLILYALLPFGRAVLDEDWKLPGKGMQALFALVSLAAGNVTENASMSMILLMALCLIWLRKQKKPVPAFFWVNLGLAVAGYGFLFFAPRMNWIIQEENIPTLGIYVNRFAECMNRLLEARWLFCAYMLLFALSWKDGEMKNRLMFSLGLVVCGILSNVVMIIPEYYPARADFGWTIFLLSASGLLMPSLEKIHGGALWRGTAACLAAVALVTFLWALPNNYDRYQQAKARIAYVEAQRDAGNLDVTIFKIKSKSKYDVYCDSSALSAEPSYLSNVCFAKYYGINTVSLSTEVN